MTRNLEWWKRICATIDTKDTDGFRRYLTEDCEFRFANGPSAIGHAAIGAAVDAFWASIRASEHHVSECWSGADSAVCELKTFKANRVEPLRVQERLGRNTVERLAGARIAYCEPAFDATDDCTYRLGPDFGTCGALAA